jgi:DNA sulfur modification protein DndD
MIIEKLILKNFLTIFGKQEIDFPISDHSSITLIIAPNNAGKTSIIRALYFLFYGFETTEREKKAINLEEIRRTNTQKTIESYVEAVILNAGLKYRVRRTLKAHKLDEKRVHVEIFNKKISMIQHKKREDLPYKDELLIENILKQMVPKGLFDFFYFKGEE